MLQLTFEEIDEVVEAYGSPLYKFCCKLTHQQSDADDLYQETFVQLVKQFRQIDRAKNPKSYLFSIAIFLWKGKCRKWARRQRIAPVVDWDHTEDIADGSDLEKTYIDGELRCLVNEEIDHLKEKLKMPLYLFYTAEMTVDEIAAVLNIPAGTVKSRLHKARQLLKTRLEAAGYE